MTTANTDRVIRRRRRYAREFKARIVAACQQPDVSIAQVAHAAWAEYESRPDLDPPGQAAKPVAGCAGLRADTGSGR